MKKKMVQFLLLFSLFFNIAHATVIALEDDCHHETQYLFDTHTDDNCGDLCEIHHAFHYSAILDTNTFHFIPFRLHISFNLKTTRHLPPFKQTTIKPPIA